MSWISKFYIHSNIKIIICGLGGTVIKDLRYLYQPFYHSLKKYGINQDTFPNDKMLDIYGKDKFVAIHDIVRQTYPKEKEAAKVIQDIYQDSKYMDHLINDFPKKAEFVNSDIPETLINMRLNGLKVVFTSAYPKNIGDKIVKDLNLHNCFDNYLFDEDTRFSTNKPSVERIQFLMKQFNVDNHKQVIKVGSNINDIVEGNFAHCGVNIATLTGYDYEDELVEVGADYIINNLSDVIINRESLCLHQINNYQDNDDK